LAAAGGMRQDPGARPVTGPDCLRCCFERLAPVVAEVKRAAGRIEPVVDGRLDAIRLHHRATRQSPDSLPATADEVSQPVMSGAARMPDHARAIGGQGDVARAFALRRLAGESRPAAAAIAGPRATYRARGPVVEVAAAHHALRRLACECEALGVGETHSGKSLLRRVQLVVYEAIDIAQPADQVRAPRRTHQRQRHSLLE